jgi:hypothetical protein
LKENLRSDFQATYEHILSRFFVNKLKIRGFKQGAKPPAALFAQRMPLAA